MSIKTAAKTSPKASSKSGKISASAFTLSQDIAKSSALMAFIKGDAPHILADVKASAGFVKGKQKSWMNKGSGAPLLTAGLGFSPVFALAQSDPGMQKAPSKQDELDALNQVTKACVDASSKVDAAINQHGMGAKDREPWVFETNSACEENKKLKEQPNLSLSREDSVVIYFHTARRLKIAEYQKEIHAKELLKSEHEIYDKKVDSDWSQCSWTGGPWADTCWSQLMTTKWNDSNDIQVAIDALNLQIDTLKEQTKKPPSLKGNAAS